MQVLLPHSETNLNKATMQQPEARIAKSVVMEEEDEFNYDDQLALVLTKDPKQYAGITQERDDPFLVIAWNLTGLAERRVHLPDDVMVIPAGAPAYAQVTLQNLIPLRVPRINLNVTDLNEILLYDDLGVQIGILKSSHLPHLSLIKYSSVPHLQSAVNRLLRLCPILRSMIWSYRTDAGNVFRIYPKSVRGSAINDLESVHMNELDNEPFI